MFLYREQYGEKDFSSSFVGHSVSLEGATLQTSLESDKLWPGCPFGLNLN